MRGILLSAGLGESKFQNNSKCNIYRALPALRDEHTDFEDVQFILVLTFLLDSKFTTMTYLLAFCRTQDSFQGGDARCRKKDENWVVIKEEV